MMNNTNYKAQDCINDVKTQLNKAETELNEAKMKAEKTENKTVIEDAISSLKSACDSLDKFQD